MSFVAPWRKCWPFIRTSSCRDGVEGVTSLTPSLPDGLFLPRLFRFPYSRCLFFLNCNFRFFGFHSHFLGLAKFGGSPSTRSEKAVSQSVRVLSPYLVSSTPARSAVPYRPIPDEFLPGLRFGFGWHRLFPGVVSRLV